MRRKIGRELITVVGIGSFGFQARLAPVHDQGLLEQAPQLPQFPQFLSFWVMAIHLVAAIFACVLASATVCCAAAICRS